MYSFKTYLPYYKRNLKVAFPVMLTQLGASLVGLFDSIMVGRYATVDLAAVSFSNALFFTVMVFAMGALMGLTPLVGIQVGSLSSDSSHGEQSNIRSLIASFFQNGMLFTVLLSFLSLVLLGGCIPFLHCSGSWFYLSKQILYIDCTIHHSLFVLHVLQTVFGGIGQYRCGDGHHTGDERAQYFSELAFYLW